MTPHEAVERVRDLAHQLGRTPTQPELATIGIYRRQRQLLLLAGVPLRSKGGRGGWRDGEWTPRPKEMPAPAKVEDAVGQRLAAGRLKLYRVPASKGDDLNPLDSWMA